MYIWVAFTSTILLTTSVNSHSQISYEHVFISLGTVPLCGIFDHMVTIVFLKNHCKASVHGQSHHQCMQVLLSINLFWCAVGDDTQSLARVGTLPAELHLRTRGFSFIHRSCLAFWWVLSIRMVAKWCGFYLHLAFLCFSWYLCIFFGDMFRVYVFTGILIFDF